MKPVFPIFLFLGLLMTAQGQAEHPTVTNNAGKLFYQGKEVKVVDFPDPKFEAVVRERITNKLWSTNQIYDLDVVDINMIECVNKGISNLEGVRELQGLSVLFCEQNGLTNLNVSGCTNLQILSCAENDLHNLNVSGCGKLTWLRCEHNNLTVLDFSENPKLHTVTAENNPLTEIIFGSTNQLLKVLRYDDDPLITKVLRSDDDPLLTKPTMEKKAWWLFEWR